MYCIYTDKEINSSESSDEHIIPLSLGGKNGFTIKVSSKANSEAGTNLDAGLNKDFFINSVRRKKDYRGRSKKVPKYRINATISDTNERVEIRYNGSENYLYNPRTRKQYADEEKKKVLLSPVIDYDKFIRIRFTAKVILGTGYYLYKDLFRKYADHDSLRKIMGLDIWDSKGETVDIPVGLMDEHMKLPDDSIKWDSMFKSVYKAMNCSGVIFIIGPNQIIGAVGIGGRYIGAINFKAEGKYFGFKEGSNDGIIVAIQNKNIIKVSFYKYLQKLNDHIQESKKVP